ncbi:MAG: hypothetical protein OSJ65_04685 [Bacilli bacterium]|nr:hypothetical protein [Bacilli bacterium]
MVKIEKERKFKTEYIPVVISSLILILFLILLFLTINYEGNVGEYNKTNDDVVNEELAITKTDSKCNQEELNELLNLASKVSGTYHTTSKEIPVEKTEENTEYIEDTGGVINYKFIEIIIKGIEEGIYVQITNNYNDDVKVIRQSDLDSNREYKYEAPNMNQKVTYTVDIYSDKYSCSKELLRKVSFDTKIYNTKSDMLACVMYPKYEGCTKLVDKAISFDEFNKGIEEYQKKNKDYQAEANANILNAFSKSDLVTADDIINNTVGKKESVISKTANKIKDNLDLIIIATIIIGIGVLVVILIMFIRRNRL